jgi:hypothetical protein
VFRGFVVARPVRHGALATGFVLVVCAVIGALSLLSYRQATGELRPLTARTTGTIVGSDGDGTAVVTWTGPDGRPLRVTVPLTGGVPAAGTGTQVAYDPARPSDAIVPGAAVLTEADRARDGMLFSGLVAALVLVTGLVLLIVGWLSARRPTREIVVRRITLRRGLVARSWLETEGPQWLPVHFEPALVSLPAPAVVLVHGDSRRQRLVAVSVPTEDGPVTLYPSGRVRSTEPLGRRRDNPVVPDGYAAGRAATASRLRRQVRVDAALLVPAPFVGALWTYLDDGGLSGWLGATALTAALALWWAAIRGADPS